MCVDVTLAHSQRGSVILEAALLAAALALLVVALPPPLCRGRTYAAYDPKQDHRPGTRALAEVQTAYEALCPTKVCGTGEIYENPTIGNNAVTWVSGLRDGKQTRAKIVYSAPFLDGLAGTFGPGASFGVLAHEVGHHLTAALSMRQDMDSSWDEELRADYLAGCALGRSGRPPTELENALRALAQIATKSHPAFNMRNTVVRKGYGDCQAAAQAPKEGSFGIGAALRAQSGEGCWNYWYRSKEEIAKVGPVAAKRKRSKKFPDRAKCEQDRLRLADVELHASQECACD